MTSAPSDSHTLARTLSQVARELEAAEGEQQTLVGMVQAAVATVPGVAYGGITQVHRGRVSAQAPSDSLVDKCDQLQNELGEGPCLDALWHHDTVLVDDMAAEQRWPAFAAQAAALGVGSMISFQLYVGDDTLGALNLYGATGTRFGHEAQLIGELFASHAALALSGARQQRQLSEALASRDEIGQAKGLLMHTHHHRSGRLHPARAGLARGQHQTHRRGPLDAAATRTPPPDPPAPQRIRTPPRDGWEQPEHEA